MEIIKLDVDMRQIYAEMYGAENVDKVMESEKRASALGDQIAEAGYDRHMEVWVDPDNFNWAEIYISGDWKHDHARLDNVMKHLGWECIGEEEDECADNCGDWYYATHIYKKAA